MGGAILSILIYFLIFLFIIIRIRKVKLRSTEISQSAGQLNTPVRVSTQYPSRKKSSGVNAHMAREKINIRGWEDRKNDWLARQMAEERVSARRMSEMFQLKLEHRYNCEAEMLKQFHEARCSADAVDTGEHS